MAIEHEKEHESSGGGLGIGLGVDLDLKLGQVRDLVHSLNAALSETGSTVTGILSDLANTIKSFGPNFKREASERGYEDEYNSLVHNLRSAADRGEAEARNLLAEMGEGVEEAGHSMKEASREEPH